MIKDGEVTVCNGENFENCFKMEEQLYLWPDTATTTEACGKDEFLVDETGYFVL